jgi:ABC-2 type transport system ATP-binding protein
MTAREVLALHCELARLPRSSWPKEIAEALELVGLADRADDRSETYSKGMQQRLGLGVALLGRPELVVLDEPTSALDPVGRQDVRRIIGALRDRGTTVFLNSHLLTEVERVCDRVAIVDRGGVVAELSMADLTQERGVRIRVTDPDGDVRQVTARYGPTRVDGEWLAVDGIADADVPALVRELVASGVAVHAVVPTRQSLEDRFMALLGTAAESDAREDAAADSVASGSAEVRP